MQADALVACQPNGGLQPVAVNGLRVARTQRRPGALSRKEVHHSSARFAQQLRLACAAASEPDVRTKRIRLRLNAACQRDAIDRFWLLSGYPDLRRLVAPLS